MWLLCQFHRLLLTSSHVLTLIHVSIQTLPTEPWLPSTSTCSLILWSLSLKLLSSTLPSFVHSPPQSVHYINHACNSQIRADVYGFTRILNWVSWHTNPRDSFQGSPISKWNYWLKVGRAWNILSCKKCHNLIVCGQTNHKLCIYCV